jgi:Eukaryotic aspartyl protease
MVQAMYSVIPGSIPLRNSPGYYIFPCDSSLIDLTFQFGGQMYRVDPRDLTLNTDGTSCLGAIIGVDIPDASVDDVVWIMGDVFMKNVISVFDLGSPAIGFGRIKNLDQNYGDFTAVAPLELTALGTGPSASVRPTMTRPSSTVSSRRANLVSFPKSLTAPAITYYQGTGLISPDLQHLSAVTGVSTSAGAVIAVTSNIPVSADPKGPPPSGRCD